MNKREFVCRAAIALSAIYDPEQGGLIFGVGEPWTVADELWSLRPQWMKDEEQLAEDAQQGYFKGKLIARLTPEDRREYEEFLGNMSSSPRVDGA